VGGLEVPKDGRDRIIKRFVHDSYSNARHSKALGLQIGRSLLVGPLVVLRPVELNHQSRSDTRKVGEIWPDRQLPPELEPAKLLASEA
jgi:hypothetical protein